MTMRIVRNKLIPFKGFRAVNLFGILFVRGDTRVSERTLNHERIHTAQMREMLYLPFYLWYVLEWIVRLFMAGDAYCNICFEREAYEYEGTDYLPKRGWFAWLKHYGRSSSN